MVNSTYNPKLSSYFLFPIFIFAYYYQLKYFPFLETYDDAVFVTKNAIVQSGLSLQNIAWAFSPETPFELFYPLTWISHMLDCHLFGLNASMHHLTNVFLHTANGWLLFMVMTKMTKNIHASLLLALCFTLHPIQIESVAWISERKGLLSAFFLLAAMNFYVAQYQHPKFYKKTASILFYTCALMSKPMALTFPFMLLLINYWPLNRFKGSTNIKSNIIWENLKINREIIFETIPYFVIAFSIGLIDLAYITKTNNITHLFIPNISLVTDIPLSIRWANVFIVYLDTFGKLLWPFNFLAFYPFPYVFPFSYLCAAIIFLTCIFSMSFWTRKSCPFLFIVWLWFIIVLSPVVTPIWKKPFAMADRYAYLPLIGVYIIIIWGILHITEKKFSQKTIFSLMIALLLIFLPLNYVGMQNWTDDLTLFKHAVNHGAHHHALYFNLANHYKQSNNIELATMYYSKALELQPNFHTARNNLATLYIKSKKYQLAQAELEYIINADQNAKLAILNYGIVLELQGKINESIQFYEKISQAQPRFVEIYNNLAILYFKLGKKNKAITLLKQAITINPKYDAARKNLYLIQNNLGTSSIQKNTTTIESHGNFQT